MNFYDMFMTPLESSLLRDIRKQIIPHASGEVLEIGIGTGANLPFYNYENINKITGVDIKLSDTLKERMNNKVAFTEIDGKVLPFAENSFDNIVTTLVLCSVDDIVGYMNELKRVLKPTGSIIFMEHILPTQSPYRKIVNKLAKPWRKVATCHLNRETDKILSEWFNIDFMKKAGKTIVCYGIGKNNK